MPIPIPTRSTTRKRTPRSRTKLRVPWVRLASQGAPMKPIHRPSSVDTTYHSGGTVAVAMAVHLRGGLAGDGAGHDAEDERAELADQEARRRRRRATSSPGAWSAGGPTGYRGTGRRPRRPRGRRGRHGDRGGQEAPDAAGTGCAVVAREATVGQTAARTPAGGTGGAAACWTHSRGTYPAGTGPGGRAGGPIGPAGRPAGLRIGHREERYRRPHGPATCRETRRRRRFHGRSPFARGGA